MSLPGRPLDEHRSAEREGTPASSAVPGLPGAMDWLQALRDPERTQAWTLADWQRVVRLARRLRLLSRLAERLDAAGLLAQVPAQPRMHLLAEMRLSRWRVQSVLWTLERLETALGDAPYPRVLLKGAAYIGQGLPIAPGRLPSDLDLLVPHSAIDDALQRLQQAGWSAKEMDEHDQRYYREWSHEVPPMHHPVHPVELDLHHNILPPVARTHVDADLLLQQLKPSNWSAWQVLQPVDQVLHSAAHLFHDSELRDRLRDLVDLDGLLRHFGTDPAFWHLLPRRARELGLGESLALAHHFCTNWLGTPVPAAAASAIQALAPGAATRWWLLPLLTQVLTPTEPDTRRAWGQGPAATLLLARYHVHRLPLRHLVPHLWHKLRTPTHADPGDFSGDGRRRG